MDVLPVIAALLAGLGQTQTLLRCGQEVAQDMPDFHFAGACVRSKMNVVGAAFQPTLDKCTGYALSRGALAINYFDKRFIHASAQNYSKENCLVYDCPEFDVQISLEIDSLYDYYSIYARPMPSTNVSCVPQIGVFGVHHERLNFTDAQDVCEEENAELTDISNAQRTIKIAKILSTTHVKEAFIGLSKDEGKFITPLGRPLECLPYRAWAPGHPKKNKKCAALRDNGYWISYDCENKLPFVCELKPSGPLHPCINLPHELRRECREIFISSIPGEDRWPQCGDPSIDENTYRLPLLIQENQTQEEDSKTNKTIKKGNDTRIKPPRKLPN